MTRLPWKAFGSMLLMTGLTSGLTTGCGGEGDEGPGEACTTNFDEAFITELTVWGDECDTIVVSQPVTVQAPLQVVQGTRVEFEQGAGLIVEGDGFLQARGTEDSRVLFVGTEGSPGWWSGIRINTTTGENHIESTTISSFGYEDLNGETAGLTIGGPGGPGEVKLLATTFENGSGPGVVVGEGGHFDNFYDNTFRHLDGAAVELPFVNLHELDGVESDYGPGTESSHVLVTRGDAVTESARWPAINVPYRVVSDVNNAVEGTGTVVTIEPGAVFEFEQDLRFEVRNGAALNAVGTAEEPIVFRGVEDVPSYWGGLEYATVREDNVLENVTVANAGKADLRGWPYAIIVHGDATAPGMLTITDATIRDSAGGGIRVNRGGQLVSSNVTFENVAMDEVLDENDTL